MVQRNLAPRLHELRDVRTGVVVGVDLRAFHHTIQGLRVSVITVHRNVQRLRGGLVFQAHRLCVSLNSRLESNKEGAISPHTAHDYEGAEVQ